MASTFTPLRPHRIAFWSLMRSRLVPSLHCPAPDLCCLIRRATTSGEIRFSSYSPISKAWQKRRLSLSPDPFHFGLCNQRPVQQPVQLPTRRHQMALEIVHLRPSSQLFAIRGLIRNQQVSSWTARPATMNSLPQIDDWLVAMLIHDAFRRQSDSDRPCRRY